MKSRLWRRMCRAPFWGAVLLIAFCVPGSVSASAQRMVFAHYMLANQDYEPDDPSGERNIASYEREIRQAQAIGIDGFALNAGGWFKEPRYIKRAAEMFEAAYRLHSNFKLFFSADMCCFNEAEDVRDMMRRFANSPRYAPLCFRHKGKFVLTTFAGSNRGAQFWSDIQSDLEHGSHPSTRAAPNALAYVNGIPSSAPLPVKLVTSFFWGGELPQAADIQAGLTDYAGIIDGAFYWGIAGVPGLGHAPDQIPSTDAYASVLHRAGKLYMAPICFQFWGANTGRYYEYSGYSGLRSLWMDAINVSHPDWIEIITWNDFVEGTYVSPIDDPARYAGANDLSAGAAPPATLHFFHSHRGVTELLPFFIEWYKTGRQPAIRNDSVFWAYRTQLAPQPRDNAAIKLYGPVADVVYVTANLTAPAVLRVSFGSKAQSIALPAGSTDTQVALQPGAAPHFELTRGDARLATGDGDDPIAAYTLPADLYYSTGFLHD
jgi:glucan endo-1,3-alpha-glucosidase